MPANALWLWGRMRDFERDGLLAAMTPPMQDDVRGLAPVLAEFFNQLVEATHDAASATGG